MDKTIDAELTELAEFIYNIKPSIKLIKSGIRGFLTTNHYVIMADDQSFPYQGKKPSYRALEAVIDYCKIDEELLDSVVRETQVDMVEAGWRKIEID